MGRDTAGSSMMCAVMTPTLHTMSESPRWKSTREVIFRVREPEITMVTGARGRGRRLGYPWIKAPVMAMESLMGDPNN
jgi:hypothetical protein